MSKHGFRAPDDIPSAFAMRRRLSITASIVAALLWALAGGLAEAARPEGTLTVAVATFGTSWSS